MTEHSYRAEALKFVLTTVKICTSSARRSLWTERLGPERAAPETHTHLLEPHKSFTPSHSGTKANISVDVNFAFAHRLVLRLLHFLLTAPLEQEHLRSDLRRILSPANTSNPPSFTLVHAADGQRCPARCHTAARFLSRRRLVHVTLTRSLNLLSSSRCPNITSRWT